MAVLLSLGPDDGSEQDSEEEGEEEEGEEEGEEEEEEEEEGIGRQDEEQDVDVEDAPTRMSWRTRCPRRETLTTAATLLLDVGAVEAGGPHHRYAIHSHFGGEGLASLLRVEMRVPPAAVPLLEWCRSAPRRFTARRAWRAARLSPRRRLASRPTPRPTEQMAA